MKIKAYVAKDSEGSKSLWNLENHRNVINGLLTCFSLKSSHSFLSYSAIREQVDRRRLPHDLLGRGNISTSDFLRYPQTTAQKVIQTAICYREARKRE